MQKPDPTATAARVYPWSRRRERCYCSSCRWSRIKRLLRPLPFVAFFVTWGLLIYMQWRKP